MLQAADLIPALRLERTLALSEPWRLITAHLVHLGWTHLLMNLAGLAIIWGLLAPAMSTRQWAVIMIASALGVSLGLLLFSPQVAWYVGLSGLLHGLLAAGALAGLRQQRGMCVLILAFLTLKLALEQLVGGDAVTARLISGTVIVDAHLYGVLAGLVCGGLLRLRTRTATG